MRYGIFSDIHSNLEALNVVVDCFKEERIDRYLCLGDIVGYAASPSECIRVVKSLSPEIIAGNHEWAVVGRFDLKYFNGLARDAILWTKSVLSSVEIDFLFSLPLVCIKENFVLVHGTLFEPGQFNYLSDINTAIKMFLILEKQVCFVGHTHRPGVFIEEAGETKYSDFSNLHIEDKRRYIINVGSVGQPRDNDPRACFVVYDTQAKTIELKRVEYNICATQERIFRAGLPELLGGRLSKGI